MKLNFHLPYNLHRTLFRAYKPAVFQRFQNMRSSNGEYSYRPFDETRSIFVHIPKTAGVSICRALYGNLAGGHSSVAHYQCVFSRREFRAYFKFTVVRNPWDRLYSAYHYLRQGGSNTADREWSDQVLSRYSTFKKFVLEWITKENIGSFTHFIPQTDLLFFFGTSQIPLNFVAFFENLEEDFKYIATSLNKPECLGHSNKTPYEQGLYLDNYSDEMIECVRAAYDTDISTFGYSFDNSALPQQLETRTRGLINTPY